MERYTENKPGEVLARFKQEIKTSALQKIQELHIEQVYKLEKQNLVSVKRFKDFIQQIKNEANLNPTTFKYNSETINSIINYLNDTPDNSDSFAALYEDLTQGYNQRDLIMILNGYFAYTHKNEARILEEDKQNIEKIEEEKRLAEKREYDEFIEGLKNEDLKEYSTNQLPNEKVDNIIPFKRKEKPNVKYVTVTDDEFEAGLKDQGDISQAA